MSSELQPFEAATLAEEIYVINAGDEIAIQILHSNPIFKPGENSKNVVSAILGIPKSQMGTKPKQSFLRYLLRELARRANELAQKAVRSIR